MTESTTTWEGHVRSAVMLNPREPRFLDVSGYILGTLEFLEPPQIPQSPEFVGVWNSESARVRPRIPIVPFTFTLGSRWSFRIQLLSCHECHEWTSQGNACHPGKKSNVSPWASKMVEGLVGVSLDLFSHLLRFVLI